MKKNILCILFIFLLGTPAFSWIYPEHRDIFLMAIKKLDRDRRKELEKYWALARTSHESRLFPDAIDTSDSMKPQFIDYAAWPGIAGDHSMSSADMMHNILDTKWILNVAAIAAELKLGIATARNPSEQQNKLRDSDTKLLKADPDYVTRAGSNNVHFMLARPDVGTDARQYFKACFRDGIEMNAAGTYAWLHLSALLKAQKFARDSMSEAERSGLMLSILADEAFAVHFLEDMFASGHVAGTWGNSAQRKGTHDYYNEYGLEVTTWEGSRFILMGDAYMRPEDAERTSEVVLKSLIEVIDVASGHPMAMFKARENVLSLPDTLNVCKTNFLPPRTVDTAFREYLRPIILKTPVPGLAKGAGSIPRFRAEVGPFIGLAASGRAAMLLSGFGKYQSQEGYTGGLELAARVGLGLEGVLNESGDGLVFLSVGWRQDGPSSMTVVPDADLKQWGSIFAAVPARDALYFRLRVPFFLIPGDVILIGPFLYLFAPKAANKMLATAGNGGLIPWQSGIVTPIGRFQFILGREIAVYFYGSTKTPDSYIIPIDAEDTDEVLLHMRTTQLEFPFLEYRPFHSFSSNQTGSLCLQFFGGFDIPGKRNVVFPSGAYSPPMQTTWNFGLRITFDWRYYFMKKKS